MKKLLSGALIAGTVAIGSLGQVSSAEAAATACTPNIVTLVTNTTGCEYVTPIPTNPAQFSVGQIQSQNFFGFTDWTSGGQNGTEIPGSGQSGTWNITSSLWQTYSDVMLVFKDGAGTSPVAYRLVQNAVTGQWASPFRNPPFTALGPDQIKDVSNITVYYRGTATTTPPNPIPTPAVLPGAIGMGIAALRKKKREQGLEEATQEA
jgi:hypothetical protein